jgi:hypothetical protein
MASLIDQAAKEIALGRWMLPECLHVPVAAVDEAAIRDYVGQIERVWPMDRHLGIPGQDRRAALD